MKVNEQLSAIAFHSTAPFSFSIQLLSGLKSKLKGKKREAGETWKTLVTDNNLIPTIPVKLVWKD